MSIWLFRMQYKAVKADITACLNDVTQIWTNFTTPLTLLPHSVRLLYLRPNALLSQNVLTPSPSLRYFIYV